jgi:hypothetical protein
MGIFRLRAKLAALTVLVLGGCAPIYWQQDLAWVGYKPTQILVVEKDDPSQLCSAAPQSVWGCAIRQREAHDCVVFIKARLPYAAYNCVITHEVRHCFGDQHDAFNEVPHNSVDCGNGEFYVPTQHVSRELPPAS